MAWYVQCSVPPRPFQQLEVLPLHIVTVITPHVLVQQGQSNTFMSVHVCVCPQKNIEKCLKQGH